MPMRKTLYTLLLPLLACSCAQKEDHAEEQAEGLLYSARTLMTAKKYAAAKDSVLTLRKRVPTALEARAAGIIVMDSIELLEAQDSLTLMDSTLKTERDVLARLKAEKRRGHNAEYLKQYTKVFHMQQHFEETEAKVKFYLRKIEVDRNENNAQ
ncbi:MAG: hypothetical protein LUC45_09005 [Paraprevotella sp.]|nr:hypothetical protein [Paraprevotella sp.]